jgi:hypothetical protein
MTRRERLRHAAEMIAGETTMLLHDGMPAEHVVAVLLGSAQATAKSAMPAERFTCMLEVLLEHSVGEGSEP